MFSGGPVYRSDTTSKNTKEMIQIIEEMIKLFAYCEKYWSNALIRII
jgi:hypothetical protein